MPTLLERLGRALLGSEEECRCDHSAPALRLVVKCNKCGELIQTRVEKAYELEAEYANNGHKQEEAEEPRPSGYTLCKELVGARCQNLVHLILHLDSHTCPGSRDMSIEGGELVEVADCE